MARAKKPTKKELDLLAAIVEATASEAGMLFASEKESAKLVELGLVEINVTITDDAGNVATRATQEGVNAMSKTNETASPEATETKAAGSFELESGIALPTVRRGGRGANIYPFDEMDVGQSFHVPVSEDKPNPAKSLASTVSSATARYKDESGEVTRKFVVRSVGAEDPKGPGARVFRVE